MMLYLQDRYINLLTDFGFKRIFGTEPNKRLPIDFLNTLLPPDRQIADVTFKNNENLGTTPVDTLRDGQAERKAIFDIDFVFADHKNSTFQRICQQLPLGFIESSFPIHPAQR